MESKEKKLGLKIQAFRRSLGLSRDKFARMVGMSHQTIIRYESAKGGEPYDTSLARLSRLAHKYGNEDLFKFIEEAYGITTAEASEATEETTRQPSSAPMGRGDPDGQYHKILREIFASERTDIADEVREYLKIKGRSIKNPGLGKPGKKENRAC